MRFMRLLSGLFIRVKRVGPVEYRSNPAETASKSMLPEGVERRFHASKVELRAAKDGKGPGQISGYAATFEQMSCDMGGWYEKLAKGAFDHVLQDDCRCLRNHNDESILGRISAGTLEWIQDEYGLWFTCDLPDTQAGRDTAESVRRRDIQGCSFQFSIAEGGEEWDFAGPTAVRTITRVGKMYDVGPVTFPAYESTRVDMRSFNVARAARDVARAEKVRQSISRAKARLRLAAASLQ
jgi:HK97 family phage prohead protease